MAALAILGGLLAAMSTARARLSQQDRVNRDRTLAISLLDRWAEANWAQSHQWDAWAAGSLKGEETLALIDKNLENKVEERAASWRLVLRRTNSLRPPASAIVPLRLEVRASTEESGAASDRPLAVLDVLVPAAKVLPP